MNTLDATWTIPSGPHKGLTGTFHGTLSQQNGTYVYTGTFHAVEGSNSNSGTMTFTIQMGGQEYLLTYPGQSNVKFFRIQ